MFSDYTKNFLIYYNNLSTYYIVCVALSFIAIILSWIFHFKNVPDELEIDDMAASKQSSKEKLEVSTIEPETNEIETVISTFKKTIKQQTMEQLAASLTEEQLMEEKEAEKQQLNAILELLKQQEEKFQIGSMDDLEGQLKLYR